MGKIIVEVSLKEEILDPQGQAVAAALSRLGFNFVTGVRQGKRFEIETADSPTAEQVKEIEKAAETMLANTVIENFIVKIEK